MTISRHGKKAIWKRNEMCETRDERLVGRAGEAPPVGSFQTVSSVIV